MFLAQTGHETGSFNTFVEYTNAGGTNAWCPRYDGGCRYRGRGAIQLTHKYNYRRAGTELGADFVNNPEIVATPRYAFEVGGLFWKWNNLNQCSDSRDMNTCTRKINGGTNGIADRRTKYSQAQRCITAVGRATDAGDSTLSYSGSDAFSISSRASTAIIVISVIFALILIAVTLTLMHKISKGKIAESV